MVRKGWLPMPRKGRFPTNAKGAVAGLATSLSRHPRKRFRAIIESSFAGASKAEGPSLNFGTVATASRLGYGYRDCQGAGGFTKGVFSFHILSGDCQFIASGL